MHDNTLNVTNRRNVVVHCQSAVFAMTMVKSRAESSAMTTLTVDVNTHVVVIRMSYIIDDLSVRLHMRLCVCLCVCLQAYVTNRLLNHATQRDLTLHEGVNTP